MARRPKKDPNAVEITADMVDRETGEILNAASYLDQIRRQERAIILQRGIVSAAKSEAKEAAELLSRLEAGLHTMIERPEELLPFEPPDEGGAS